MRSNFFFKEKIRIAIVVLTILFFLYFKCKTKLQNSWCYWTNLKWWSLGAAFSVLSSKTGSATVKSNSIFL